MAGSHIMKAKPHLSDGQRWKVVHTWQQLGNLTATAEQLGISRQTVSYWINRFKKTGSVTPRKSTGRPRLMSEEVAQLALEMLLEEEHGAADGVSKELHTRNITAKKVSAVTVRRATSRAAKAEGAPIYFKRGRPKKMLSEATKKKRLEFAYANRKTCWARVLITDRKRFYFRYPGCKVRHGRWVRRGESVEANSVSNPQCFNIYLGITKYGATECHPVAGTSNHKSPYTNKKGQPARNITAAEYRDVMKLTLLPGGSRIMAGQGISSWVYQQDNDPCHSGASQLIKQWSETRGSSISLLGWPPNSPDMSPIENLWGYVQGQVDALGCKTFEEYKQAVRDHIKKLPKSYFIALFNSMPGRIAKVIKTRGGRIDY